MTREQLNTRRNELAGQIRQLADAHKRNGGEFVGYEDSRWDKLNAEYDSVMAQLEAAERSDAIGGRLGDLDRHDEPAGVNPLGIGRDANGLPAGSVPMGTQSVASTPVDLGFRDARTGQPLPVYRHGQPMASAQRPMGEPLPNAGDLLVALATGQASSPEYAQQIGGSDTSGGYFLSPAISTVIVDLARSASVTQRAGAMTMPINGETRIVTVDTDPTSVWRQEGGAITSSEVAFGGITLRPKTLACLIPFSVELLEDASNAARTVEQVVANVMAQKLDEAALQGTGAAAEPLGILNTSGVNTVTAVGTPTGYEDISTAVSEIYTSNYQGPPSGLAWVAHPRDFLTFDNLLGGDAHPLAATPWTAQLQRFMTTAMPITQGAGAESSMIVGDFTQCLIGMRTPLRVEVFRSGSATDSSSVTHNALDEMKVWLRVYMRADVAVLRPGFFNVLSGVTNT